MYKTNVRVVSERRRVHNIYVIGVARLTARGPCQSAQGLGVRYYAHTHTHIYITRRAGVGVHVINYYNNMCTY